METREYTVYKFDELPEDAKEKVIQRYSDINVDHNWWEYVIEEAKELGIDIPEFDTYRGTIKGSIITSAPEVAEKIMADHGKDCDTYKTAKAYYTKLEEIGLSCDDEGYIRDKWETDREELDKAFEYDILQDYLSLLQKDYEYLTSEEAIIETIKANDYDFTIEGKID